MNVVRVLDHDELSILEEANAEEPSTASIPVLCSATKKCPVA
jgi:hypothetical protein